MLLDDLRFTYTIILYQKGVENFDPNTKASGHTQTTAKPCRYINCEIMKKAIQDVNY